MYLLPEPSFSGIDAVEIDQMERAFFVVCIADFEVTACRIAHNSDLAHFCAVAGWIGS